MAEPMEVNLRLLSGSTDGLPVLITGTTAGAPTVVHESEAVSTHIDLVTLWLCNTHSSDLLVTVVVFTGSSATSPDQVVWQDTIPAQSGTTLALDQYPMRNGKKVGVYCGTGSKITAAGRVAEATTG